MKWLLFFTLYIPAGDSQVLYQGSYETREACLEASHKERPKTDHAVAGYCMPETWVLSEMLNMKTLGWH